MPSLDLTHLLARVGLSDQAEDCAITSISPTHSLITNIDVVTPIHDDPFTMGQIAAVNVTNDLFAVNALHLTGYSCFLGMPFGMPEDTAAELLRGTRDILQALGTDINGGHTIQNPWPLMGGTATAVEETRNLIYKYGARPGDRLVLTKPLGVHPVMAADRTQKTDVSYLEGFELPKIQSAVAMATKIMTTSNQPVALAIHEGDFLGSVHAMTDITGFGFRVHLGEMLAKDKLGAQIRQLPTIPYALELDEMFCYGLQEGKSAEIAGPMLLAVDPNTFEGFTDELSARQIWWMEIGTVTRQFEGVQFEGGLQFTEIEHYGR